MKVIKFILWTILHAAVSYVSFFVMALFFAMIFTKSPGWVIVSVFLLCISAFIFFTVYRFRVLFLRKETPVADPVISEPATVTTPSMPEVADAEPLKQENIEPSIPPVSELATEHVIEPVTEAIIEPIAETVEEFIVETLAPSATATDAEIALVEKAVVATPQAPVSVNSATVAADPHAALPKKYCQRCGSDNINVQAVSETQLKNARHGCAWWLFFGWWWVPFKWIFLFVPALIVKLFGHKKVKLETTHKTLFVCQSCGYSWQA